MKGKFLKTLSLAAAFAIVSPAFSDGDGCGCCNPCKTDDSVKKDQGCGCGCPVEETQLIGAYNAPARIDVKCPWDVFVSGSFIWWLPKENGLDVAATYTTAAPHGHVHFSHIDGEYKPGFKVMLGMDFDHDNWVVDLEYTWLHCSHGTSASVNTDTGTLTPLWLSDANSSGNTFNNAHGSWRLEMDLLDLRMSRPFYSGTHLTLTPFIGLRGGWLDQHYNAHYIDTTFGTVSSRSNQESWLIGPRAGIQSNWLIGCGFRIFGDVNASLFYQRFETHFHEHDASAPTTVWASSSETSNLLTPNLEMILGLGYGTYFSCNSWHFDVLVGYNFQIFWNQNLMRNLKDRVSNVTGVTDGAYASIQDLMLHGLTATIRLDF